MFGKDVNFRMVRLTADNENVISGFNCGIDGIDLSEYLHECAARDNECVTYVFVTPENKTIAYASLSCTSIVAKYREEMSVSKYIPAVLIDKFAVDSDYQHMRYEESEDATLSEYIFLAVLDRIFYIMTEMIGAKYIVLYSTERAQHFYQKCDFVKFENFMEIPSDPYTQDCIAMYLGPF